MSLARQLPRTTAESAPFWGGGAHGQLLIQQCAHCLKYHHPPLPICPVCLGREVRPTPVSGRATVHSHTVNHQPWLPGMAVPFVVAYVALDEQPDVWLMSNIIGCEPEEVFIGQPVEVCFEQQEDVWIPLFRPRSAS
ncbi:MAG: OB-fold domain-containing protein [Burkholderiaceae bacterium]|nr:OB-fold domain-containing protein [Burkholderiaceae bacterium]MDP3138361.1 OB-fold domain-containing protein [Burkholderiaceae bacterium]